MTISPGLAEEIAAGARLFTVTLVVSVDRDDLAGATLEQVLEAIAQRVEDVIDVNTPMAAWDVEARPAQLGIS